MAFPLVMAVGGLLGLLGIPIPGVEIAIAVTGLVLGLMVLFEVKAPLGLAALIAPSARKDGASPSRPLSSPGGLMEQSDASLQRGRQG